jgi:2-polyprenyl-3-methyl-5-hydroxy-6-metoxy-1,4-benzoquinol methylase
MNYKLYTLLQSYVHAGYSKEKNIFLRELDSHKKLLSTNCEPRVLELACGGGNLTSIFPASSYMGIDLDADRIRIAQTKYPQYSFKTCDINSAEFEYLVKGFDFIFCYGFLHHINDRACSRFMACIKEMAMKPTTFIAMEPILPLVWINPLGFVIAKLDGGHFVRSTKEYRLLSGDNNLRIEYLHLFPKWPVDMGVFITTYK